jgi:hypothetical protein
MKCAPTPTTIPLTPVWAPVCVERTTYWVIRTWATRTVLGVRGWRWVPTSSAAASSCQQGLVGPNQPRPRRPPAAAGGGGWWLSAEWLELLLGRGVWPLRRPLLAAAGCGGCWALGARRDGGWGAMRRRRSEEEEEDEEEGPRPRPRRARARARAPRLLAGRPHRRTTSCV